MTTRSDYVLAELRCALLRAKLWQADIANIGKALAAGWISPEQAVEALGDCDCLQLVEAKGPAACTDRAASEVVLIISPPSGVGILNGTRAMSGRHTHRTSRDGSVAG